MKIIKDNTIENGTITGITEGAPAPAPITDFPKAPVTEAMSGTASEPQSTPDPVPSRQNGPVLKDDRPDDDFPDDSSEEPKPKRRFFRQRAADADDSRDKLILSRIDDAHLMEYLTLEQKRFEQQQAAKEKRENRIFTAFRLLISLAAIVAVVYLLKDNPTILVNILYIAGILAAIWFLKNPKDKSDKK